MKKSFFATVALFIILNFNAFSSESMRACMLLPITDGIDNKIGFKVFEDLEEYLKESLWCVYKSNSELINVLSQYNKNLEMHLSNKDVLKIIADKTKAGSVIKVSLQMSPGFSDVGLEVISDNGEDRYFKEKVQLKSNDISLISQTIKNWLELYEKTIPYSGRVRGILGDQITIDIGKKSNVYNGAQVIIERAIGKRQHPLLKEVVDYQTEKIAEARIFEVNEMQAQAKITQGEANKRVKLEDWVKIKAEEKRKAIDEISVNEEERENSFGKLGTFGLFLNFGTSSLTQTGSSIKTKSGAVYGADLETELWLSRNYWIGLDIGRKIGNQTTESGTFSTDKYSVSNSVTRIKAGYKYLPLGFFYGPQVDFYLGYAGYTYGYDTNTTDQITEVSFSGLMLGAKGSIPIYERTRLFLNFEFLMTSSFKEKTRVFGTDESSSNYRLEFGGQYAWAPNISLVGGIAATSNKASFTGATKEEQFKDISAKVGSIFTF